MWRAPSACGAEQVVQTPSPSRCQLFRILAGCLEERPGADAQLVGIPDLGRSVCTLCGQSSFGSGADIDKADLAQSSKDVAIWRI
jgi:hypothetical protein